MREQAALLGQKTQNLVEARVDTRADPYAGAGQFVHTFKLVVPTLDDYTYDLFEVSHPVSLYPVTAHGPGRSLAYMAGKRDELNTEDEFKNWLKDRLGSDETKKIIGNLLAQVTS